MYVALELHKGARLGPIIIGIHSSSKRVKIVDKSAPASSCPILNHLDHTLMYGWDG